MSTDTPIPSPQADDGRQAGLSSAEPTTAERLAEHDRLLSTLSRLLSDSATETERQRGLLERLARGVGQPDDATEAKSDDDEQEPDWSGWADRASAQDWADLANWVDWLALTYGLRNQPVHPCWPRHGGAVEELAALWMAWQQATGSSQANDWQADEALAYWHDRYLPGCLHRLQRLYSLADCRSTAHEDAVGKPRPTDRAGIVVHTTGEVPFADKQADTGSEENCHADAPA